MPSRSEVAPKPFNWFTNTSPSVMPNWTPLKGMIKFGPSMALIEMETVLKNSRTKKRVQARACDSDLKPVRNDIDRSRARATAIAVGWKSASYSDPASAYGIAVVVEIPVDLLRNIVLKFE